MIERFHGIDRHKKHFTASVPDREGKEIEFVAKCADLRGYIEKLGAEDAVIMGGSLCGSLSLGRSGGEPGSDLLCARSVQVQDYP